MKTETQTSAAPAAHTPRSWATTQHRLFWMLTRELTNQERENIGLSKTDARPMSILGVSSDGLACVVDKDDADLIVRAVNSHAELLGLLKRLTTAAECLCSHVQSSGHDELDKLCEQARAAISKAEGRT